MLPEYRDLPTGKRRRVRGLRREDVAELAGISTVWYGRFEAGRAVLSLSALNRVADALCLSADERAHMFLLARPDLGAITHAGLNDSLGGTGVVLSELHRLSRACSAASSVDEMVRAATRTVHLILGAESRSFFQGFDSATGTIPFLALFGREGDGLDGYRQPCSTIPHVMPTLLDGHGVGESDLRKSPSSELRGRTDVGYYAYYSQPIMGPTGLRYIVGAAFREVHAPSSLEVATIRLVAGMCELAIGSSAGSTQRT